MPAAATPHMLHQAAFLAISPFARLLHSARTTRLCQNYQVVPALTFQASTIILTQPSMLCLLCCFVSVNMSHELCYTAFCADLAHHLECVQLLPAPFPTTKPWRLYCSNMAVAASHRRQGLAAALLHQCQRVGEALLIWASDFAASPTRA